MFTMEELLSNKNQHEALEHLMGKKNGSGNDGIKVSQFSEYWELNGTMILEQIRKGEYVPGIIESYEILGRSGKKREVCSLNVTDRLITRMISQKMKRYWEREFLQCSFAYQEEKGIQEAVKKAHEYIEAGNKYVVEIDIKSYFDSINLERLCYLLQSRLNQDVFALIKKYLYCKIRKSDHIVTKDKGLVQGNPISPILSNIYLQGLDEYMEKRGYHWLRFADDIRVYTPSQDDAIAIYDEILRVLKKKYSLRGNENKTGVYLALNRRLLGYDFYKYGGKIEIRRHTYKQESIYNNWHTCVVQKINQEYHIVNDGIINRQDYAMLFENDDLKVHIPVEAAEQINVYSNVTISGSALNIIAQNQIRVSFVNKYGEAIGFFTPAENTKDAKVMLAQAKIYTDNKQRAQIAKAMEVASIHNMRANLRYYNKKNDGHLENQIQIFSNAIKEMNETKGVEQMLMIEARIRQQYYQIFNEILKNDEFRFESRTRRPPKDELNSMISFGNTLLYNSFLRVIWKTSLEPKIGIVHAANRRAYSLNLDFADIFKPILVDRLIFSLINKKQVKAKEHFEREEDGAVLLNKQGKFIMVEAFQKKLKDKIVIKNKNVSYQELMQQEVWKYQNYIWKGEKYKPYKYY